MPSVSYPTFLIWTYPFCNPNMNRWSKWSFWHLILGTAERYSRTYWHPWQKIVLFHFGMFCYLLFLNMTMHFYCLHFSVQTGQTEAKDVGQAIDVWQKNRTIISTKEAEDKSWKGLLQLHCNSQREASTMISCEGDGRIDGTSYRKSLFPSHNLFITLRHLAYGVNYHSLFHNFNFAHNAISLIFNGVYDAFSLRSDGNFYTDVVFWMVSMWL